MQRTRLYDVRLSRLPALVGKCEGDVPGICQIVNSAQRRLLMCIEAGEEGWWGTYAEIRLNVSRTQPYVTMPREVARLEAVAVCDEVVPLNNQFFEYMDFGNGRMPKQFVSDCPIEEQAQVYSRNSVPTFVDLSAPPQYIRAYASNPSDYGKRVLIQGLDQNSLTVYTLDNVNRVSGVFLTLATPFVQSPLTFNSITGVQKDATLGPVMIYQSDPTTGAEVLLLTMEPGETTAWYRRYYLDKLPLNCCPSSSATTAQVTAIVKLDLVPVCCDTDYLLIGNIEAITEEAQAVRLSEIDKADAKAMAALKHKEAVRLLNGELQHFIGIQKPAISFSPFGTATLEKQRIGRIL